MLKTVCKGLAIVICFLFILGTIYPCTTNHVSYAKQVKQANQETENQSSNEATQKNDLAQRIVVFLLLCCMVLAVIGIIMGLSDKAIFYMDGKDVITSFIPFILPFIVGVGLAILNSLVLNFGKWFDSVPAIVGILTAILCIAFVFKKTYEHNEGRKFVTLSVALGKMFLAFLGLFMFKQLTSYDKNKSAGQNFSNQASAAIWLGVIIWLMTKLINGQRVLEAQVAPAMARE